MKRLDCKGMACPKPVIMTKKELEGMGPGELEVVVDNEGAKENVSRLAMSQGHNYEIKEVGKFYYITIKKGNTEEKTEVCPVMDMEAPAVKRGPVILIGSDKLGEGDAKLGGALMKSYIYALTEAGIKPEGMLFLNAGVRLTTEGSDVIESIKKLEEQGTEILSCGTCLEFYGLSGKLLVGNVTNMYTIVEKMNGSSNTIKL